MLRYVNPKITKIGGQIDSQMSYTLKPNLLADNSTHLSQFFANVLAIFYKFFCEFLAKMTMKNKSHVSPTFSMVQPFRRLTNYLLVSAIATLSTIAIAGSAVAERREVDIRLLVNQDEGFTVMTRKAETLARSAAQRTFDREVLVSDVSIKVTAQNLNQDQAAIILQLIVSRREWASRPDPKIWATYFPMAKSLIGIR